MHLEKFICAKEAAEANVCFHDDCTTDNDRKHDFLKEALQHPRVLRLSIHYELCCDTKLAKHEAEKFDTLEAIKLAVIPKLASGLKQRIPSARQRK
jgi:hypothetical protein